MVIMRVLKIIWQKRSIYSVNWSDINMSLMSDLMEEKFDECIQEMESLRIDIESECQYRDPNGMLRDKYERANEMLDDCIEIVKKYRGY